MIQGIRQKHMKNVSHYYSLILVHVRWYSSFYQNNPEFQKRHPCIPKGINNESKPHTQVFQVFQLFFSRGELSSSYTYSINLAINNGAYWGWLCATHGTPLYRNDRKWRKEKKNAGPQMRRNTFKMYWAVGVFLLLLIFLHFSFCGG